MKSKKPIAKAFDDEDGNLYQEAYLDGYCLATILEGVIIKCSLDSGGYLTVSFLEKDIDFLKEFNTEFWLKQALSFAEQNDIFNEKESGGRDLAFVDLI